MQQKKVKQKPKREQIATDFEWLISSPCTVGSQVSLLSVVFFFFSYLVREDQFHLCVLFRAGICTCMEVGVWHIKRSQGYVYFFDD